jgi:hypothetical protein
MMSDYMEYVLPFTRYNKKSGESESRLYMQVHGRIKIFRTAHSDDAKITEDLQLDWRTNPNSGGGLLVVQGTLNSSVFGTVYEVGTANIGSGTSGVDKTNPVENAVTSWRGRAIGAMGIGLIPGSGCTLEEIQEAEARNNIVERRESGGETGGDSGQSSNDQQQVVARVIAMMKTKCEDRKIDFETRMTELFAEDNVSIETTVEDALAQMDVNVVAKYLGRI